MSIDTEQRDDTTDGFELVEVKRKGRIQFRVFEWEHEKIIDKARRVGGISTGVYCREVALGREFTEKETKTRWLRLGQLSSELVNNQRAFNKSMKMFSSLKESGNNEFFNVKSDEILDNLKRLMEQQVVLIKAIEELRKEIFS